MRFSETFRAKGHPNIRARHLMTLMVTKDPSLTLRGDCIVAVQSEKGLIDLDSKLRSAIRSEDAVIRMTLKADDLTFEVVGKGHPDLTLDHPTDMVARKSRFISDRTLMIHADKAARDIQPSLLRLLQRENQIIEVTVTVDHSN